MKDVYTENYKTLIKETENTNDWEDIQFSWIVKVNNVKISITSKTMY